MNYDDHAACMHGMGLTPGSPCPESERGIHEVVPVAREDGRGWDSSPCILCGASPPFTPRGDHLGGASGASSAAPPPVGSHTDQFDGTHR